MKSTQEFAVLTVAISLVTAATRAQNYEMSWSTVDGGGIVGAAGGHYELSATLGQPDAGDLAGGAYVLRGGFLPGVTQGGGEGCTGNEVFTIVKCKIKRGAVKHVSALVKKARPFEVYTAVLDTGQNVQDEVNSIGQARFLFKGKNAPACGPNGVTVCDVKKAFNCGC